LQLSDAAVDRLPICETLRKEICGCEESYQHPFRARPSLLQCPFDVA
jgi:hypothetical protein